MTRTRLLLGRCDHPDIVGKPRGDLFEHLEAGGMIAVVIGEQDTHQRAGSIRSRPWIYGLNRSGIVTDPRSEEHTYELQSPMRTSYAVFCLKKKNTKKHNHPQ